MNGLYGALSRLLERLEAEDTAGAAMILAEVNSQLTEVRSAADLLELRLLNARCQEAAKHLVRGLESKIQGAAVSNRALTAYSR
ncbi:MAG: hypothetical protein QM723_18025 [Myxococcaceae bacterium]